MKKTFQLYEDIIMSDFKKEILIGTVRTTVAKETLFPLKIIEPMFTVLGNELEIL
jgi:hypothetical protein